MGAMLTEEQFDRETKYRVALSIMGDLHARGLLTDKEYGHQFWLGNSPRYGPVYTTY